jgi:hypothetical protein
MKFGRYFMGPTVYQKLNVVKCVYVNLKSKKGIIKNVEAYWISKQFPVSLKNVVTLLEEFCKIKICQRFWSSGM